MVTETCTALLLLAEGRFFLLYRKYQPKTTKMSLLKKEKPQSGMYNLN